MKKTKYTKETIVAAVKRMEGGRPGEGSVGNRPIAIPIKPAPERGRADSG